MLTILYNIFIVVAKILRITGCHFSQMLTAFWTEQRVTTALKRLSADKMVKATVALAQLTNVAGKILFLVLLELNAVLSIYTLYT